MIELSMYFGIGFLLAALSVLVVAPLVHGRAARLTMRRLEATIPLSMAEVHADKDLLRAEFAMSTRRLETNVEQLKTKSASQLAEIGRKGDAINRLKIELGTLRDQLHATEKEYAVKATAVQEAERALSDKELQLAKLMGELDERSTLADAQKIEIITLKTQVEAMKIQLDGAGNELKAVEDNRDAERALSDKELQLAKLMGESEERSTLAEVQKTEIIALKTQVEAMKERLDGANNELKAVEDRRDGERIELKAATEKLIEERSKFENFHRRVTELVQQLMAQSTEDKILGHRAQELEKRLVVQSRLLNERESELEHLRGEIEIARKAEADLRIAMIEIDGRELCCHSEPQGREGKAAGRARPRQRRAHAACLRARQYAAAGRGTLRGRAGRECDAARAHQRRRRWRGGASGIWPAAAKRKFRISDTRDKP